MNIKRYIPKPIKHLLIFFYVLGKLVIRGSGSSHQIILNLAGVLPPEGNIKIVHGGKVKLLALRERFGETWRRFNIVYFASSGLPFAPSIWLRLYKLFGIKIVWNQNGVAYPALYSQEVVERINRLYRPINLCDFVIYQTEFCKRSADKFATKFSGPSTVLINPVDINHFKPRETALPNEPFVIIMSGHHFESEERMDISVGAVKKLRDEGINARLLIIGRAESVPKANWIEETGPFSQAEAPSLYRRAHILLHLKYLDPCPAIVLEALASGLPVVAQANGGLPEMMSADAGILIKVPEDYNNLHYPSIDEAVSAIMEVRGNLGRFSQGARKQALKFDKEVWLAKHEEIFNNLLK